MNSFLMRKTFWYGEGYTCRGQVISRNAMVVTRDNFSGTASYKITSNKITIDRYRDILKGTGKKYPAKDR